MKQRRALVAGIKPEAAVDPAIEEAFVYSKAKPDETDHVATEATMPAGQSGKGTTAGAVSRVPFTTRIRAEFSAALKRASLERQLNGVQPNTLQDILEEAVEPWLRANGYLH